MSKKPIIITLVAAAAVVAALLLAKKAGLFGAGSDAAGEEAYVMPVKDLAGLSGSVDYFSGVVESQETWSVAQNPEYTVRDIYVKAGDEVKEGDPLFTYDEEKFQSDLSQAEIDLERLITESDGLDTAIAALNKEKSKAPASEQANYTIQIQQQELEKKQKELDIRSKQIEIDKLKDNIENATVTSGIDGIVQSVNTGEQTVYYGNEDTSSFIKVMRTGDLRVKGKVNEQNIGQLYEGMELTVKSRVSDETWDGTLTKIDRENSESGQNGYYGGDTSAMSSSYPFYVDLKSSEGLMLGQHVYLIEKKDDGSGGETGIWLDSFYVDETDPAAPFVWADDGNGKLVKKPVVIGDRDEEMMRVKITEGLDASDAIAFPDETLKEGMACVNAADMMNAAEGGDGPEEGGDDMTGGMTGGEEMPGEMMVENGGEVVG